MIRILSSIESLEARIAPATLNVVNPLADIVAGSGKTGATVELSELFDGSVAHPNHTIVTFTVNLDSDTTKPGIQPSTFVMELFDDEAPLTVQNFLSYVQNPDTTRDFIGTFFHRAISDFIVQGGAFNTTNLTQHLVVGPEVHNEFSETRSNTIGTVAMAKTGLGPDTATSEWFVNVADNSANLDAQNGGFTVFGQIISGLDVFTKIAALPKISRGGALTDLPVQNYNSDPDHNPATPAPAPTANQLITITGVKVAKPAPGSNFTGYTIDPHPTVTNSTTPNLITPTIVGTQLKLAYAPGLSGEADVTVHITKGADSVDETIHVTVLPNLIADIVTDPLPNIIVPGDAGSAVIKLTNNGSGTLTSNVDIKFYLSKITSTEQSGSVFDPSDLLVGSATKAVSLAGGASVNVSVPIAVQKQLAAVDGEGYRLIAQVTPAADSTTELFTDDNTAVNGKAHALVNDVGTVSVANYGTRVIPQLTIVEADGDEVVVKLTGPGHVVAKSDGTEFDLSVSGTSALSTLAVSAKPSTTHIARVELHNTDIESLIGTVNFAGADIDGYTTISSGAQVLSFGNLSGDHQLIIGSLQTGVTVPVSITAKQITDYSIESDLPISKLVALSWRDTTGQDDHLIAPSIGTLNITGAAATTTTTLVRGDFEANVTLEGGAKTTLFRVAGFFEDATFTALRAASIDTITLGGMDHASIFLGTTDRPTKLGDFTSKRTIGTFTITGAAAPASDDVFIDSQVAAATIGAISVVRIDTASGTGDFGFVADTIARYVANGTAPILNYTIPGIYQKVGNYSVTIL